MLRKIRALRDRFDEKFEVVASGCWEWRASKGNGYGRIGLGRVSDGWGYAHRVSWMIHKGPIPEGLSVLHRCDNPCCVNPEHLFLGTKADNSKDMFLKGRAARCGRRGEQHRDHKLTSAQVSEIRASDLGCVALSRLYSVSHQAISQIRRGQTWKSI